ncbi:MAG: bifunctional 2-polyprenyl-6-hydroxyphenol methylase/3-demethylubiquinol 3-O-methyltransferase UbiG [Alphaproteobacteria bacterium]|jgi:2-polyprenyl-6-hydroxyphenyl methylase/3-demethylubiquinone-9 3-methyltransferase|nr:bifunctional 2-polyprenyl-6-hydroxyphenol methylase/3-demethylubiquinol 3-O-methyltransferase UbiG [Alphaproteobacteria bacterium]MDP6812519.1 bifunctional 2-polyprenyl-6-hydroxyphenol methylase/3-demethylubiquinol 3-O-methyltransferase UbiG [Alphaproteobacteria bacterium]
MTVGAASVDPVEIDRFEKIAEEWWDPDGPMRPLHHLNRPRLAYSRDRLCRHFGRPAADLRPLRGLRLLDVGCGGGLLSEPFRRLGAEVTAIDAGADNIAAAQRHAARSGLEIDYRVASAEALAGANESFDVVVSMEVVEHVADLAVFLDALVTLCRPGGALLLSTLNRTTRSYLAAIVGAEYLLRWLPAGTHDWRRFRKPAELGRHLRRAGARLEDVTGVRFDPGDRDWHLCRDPRVNYLAYASKAEKS